MLTRRQTLTGLLGPAALFGLNGATLPARGQGAALGSREKIRVTKIETFVLKNSWVFVKISTDTGIVGWGEMLKDDAKAKSVYQGVTPLTAGDVAECVRWCLMLPDRVNIDEVLVKCTDQASVHKVYRRS